MKQLQKLKMQEILDEIQADEELAAEHQFYGEQAFQEWLRNRGLPPKPTRPISTEKRLEQRSSPEERMKSREKIQSGKALPEPLKREASQGLYQPNSLQAPSQSKPKSPWTSRGSHERKVQEASKRNAFGSRGREATAFSQSTDSGDMGLHEGPMSQSSEQPPEVSDARAGLYHLGPWNKSTKVPETFGPYMAMLPDYYPRDEYTMLPKHSAKRQSRSPTFLLAEQGSAQSRKGSCQERTKSKTRAPLRERSVVYKCKHVADLHTKRHADPEKLPRDEIGMHMTNDTNSKFFQSGLLTRRRLQSPDTTTSGVSHRSDSAELYRTFDMERMLQTMKRMHGPRYFHDIGGEEYDLDQQPFKQSYSGQVKV